TPPTGPARYSTNRGGIFRRPSTRRPATPRLLNRNRPPECRAATASGFGDGKGELPPVPYGQPGKAFSLQGVGVEPQVAHRAYVAELLPQKLHHQRMVYPPTRDPQHLGPGRHGGHRPGDRFGGDGTESGGAILHA